MIGWSELRDALAAQVTSGMSKRVHAQLHLRHAFAVVNPAAFLA